MKVKIFDEEDEKDLECDINEFLEDLVLLALNDVLQQVEDETEKVMGKYTNNLNIPGF